MAKTIMLQGTSSHVGKSILTTALCRIFRQNGDKVVPFKAQNMALNSYVTKNGEEMGRAQVAQAEAAGLEPRVEMNPVLLKPTGNSRSQVILMGRPIGNMSAQEYHNGYSLKAFDVVKASLESLQKEFETIVIEGAGSPAEVNLKANDIVNMRVAKHLNAPVLLIADIDRGGALASLVGTLALLDEEERALVKGLIINKFRGDIRLLEPALTFLEEKTGKPVLGVIPHLENLGIDDEDSVSLEEKNDKPTAAEIKIAVIRTPKISNFTDFDSLANECDVDLYYVQKPEDIGEPDLILLPGSKNTTEDLLYLRQSGHEQMLREKLRHKIPLIGICGGYQMLGQAIHDPEHTESTLDSIDGLKLLPTVTTFVRDKITTQVKAAYSSSAFLGEKIQQINLHGYEIHMGRTEFLNHAVQQPFTITERSNQTAECLDGAISQDGLVMGTYIHGVFDNDEFRRCLLNILRQRKGLPPRLNMVNTYAQKQASYNRLADTVRQNLNMTLINKIMEEQS